MLHTYCSNGKKNEQTKNELLHKILLQSYKFFSEPIH